MGRRVLLSQGCIMHTHWAFSTKVLRILRVLDIPSIQAFLTLQVVVASRVLELEANRTAQEIKGIVLVACPLSHKRASKWFCSQTA